MRLTQDVVDSPIGPLALLTDDEGVLRGLSFGPGPARSLARDYPDAEVVQGEAPGAVRGALAAYFDGERAALARVPWAVRGEGFAPAVWRTLARIPVGATWSYGQIAREVGEPGAAQAAGAALNANPVALVLPCHRVIGADGALTGFGGGLERKRWLLQHEGALLL